jgi:hypothetical protein
MWRAPINASKWQMGFNSAFKDLKIGCRDRGQAAVTHPVYLTDTVLIVRCKVSHVNDCRTVGTTGLFGKHSYSVCEMFAWPL